MDACLTKWAALTPTAVHQELFRDLARSGMQPARVAALFDLLRGPGDASLRRDLREALGGMMAKRLGGGAQSAAAFGGASL